MISKGSRDTETGVMMLEIYLCHLDTI